MKEYNLVENNFLDAKLGSIFHSPNFFQLHLQSSGYYFEWVSDAHVAACIHFTEQEGGLWRSPARGTFAGYAFDPDLSLENLFAFHGAVTARLALRNPRAIEVLLPPMAHDPVAFSKQQYLLQSDGFDISHCDLNYSLTVNECPLASHMSYGNQKRLRKCQRAGLIGKQLALSMLPIVFEVLSANRASKGYSMSMTLIQLQSMAQVFPNAFVLFGVEHANQFAASALCIRLSQSVLYVFYWGDLPGYSTYSPVVTLADTIYSYCQSEGIKLLDVGTATENCTPNHGLIQFKRGLGFTESLKVRMRKKL